MIRLCNLLLTLKFIFILLASVIAFSSLVYALESSKSPVVTDDQSEILTALRHETASGLFLYGLFGASPKPNPSIEILEFIEESEYQLQLEEMRLEESSLLKKLGWNPASYITAKQEGESRDEWQARREKLPIRKELMNAYKDCTQESSWSGSDPRIKRDKCLMNIFGADYDNYYQRSGSVPLSIQLKRLQTKAPSTEDRERLEAYLTDLLNTIRSSTLEILRNKGEQPMPQAKLENMLHPVSVVIKGSGHNITASYGSPVLVIPEDILRDIYGRAMFRALLSVSALMKRFEFRAYSKTLGDSINLLTTLPGLRNRHLSKIELLQAMDAVADPDVQERWRHEKTALRYTDETDVINILGPEQTRRVISLLMEQVPNLSGDEELIDYLAWVENFYGKLESDDEFMELAERKLEDGYIPYFI